MATIKTATSLSTLRSAATELKKHLAKADTNRDGSVTTAEVKKYAKGLSNGKAVENALVTLTSYALNAQGGGTKVKVAGVTKRVNDVLESITARDANKNGKIDLGKELTRANTLKTFQALAELANARAAAPAKLTAAQLGSAMKPLFKDANFSSESDYAPLFVSGALPGGKITGAAVVDALKKPLGDFMKEDFDITGLFKNGNLADGAIEELKDSKKFIAGLEEYHVDEDPNFQPSPEAFKKLNAVMKQGLTDVKVFYFGQKDDVNPNEVDGSPGLCCFLVVGKTSDGKVAGMLLGAVHT
ncbi:MAG: hypothetical protein JNG84_06960 [Archangium sp.]|nr:hypothetical protein [Archangium sp.]